MVLNPWQIDNDHLLSQSQKVAESAKNPFGALEKQYWRNLPSHKGWLCAIVAMKFIRNAQQEEENENHELAEQHRTNAKFCIGVSVVVGVIGWIYLITSHTWVVKWLFWLVVMVFARKDLCTQNFIHVVCSASDSGCFFLGCARHSLPSTGFQSYKCRSQRVVIFWDYEMEWKQFFLSHVTFEI